MNNLSENQNLLKNKIYDLMNIFNINLFNKDILLIIDYLEKINKKELFKIIFKYDSILEFPEYKEIEIEKKEKLKNVKQ